MDLPGRTASVFFFSLGLLIVALSGCTGRSGREYERYDQLEKTGEFKVQSPKVQGQKAVDGTLTQKAATASDRKSAAASPVSKTPQSSRQDSSAVAMAKPSTATPPEIADRKQTPASSASAQQVGAPPKANNQVASATGSADASRKPQVLIPTMSFKPEGAEAAWRVSYNDLDLLKVLNMDPVTPDAPAMMPGWLKGLDGRRIRIRGFMYPTFQQTGIRAFALARDNQICCFGRNPKIYDVFDVMLREGVTTSYLPNRPFDVVGVFHIRPEVEDGKLYRIYEMDDAVIVTR